MNLVLVVLLVAMVGVVLARKRLGEKASGMALGGLGAVGLVLVVINLAGGDNDVEDSRRLERALQTACGYMLGQRVGEDHHEGGRILILQHTSPYLSEAMLTAQVKGVRDGLGEGTWEVLTEQIGVTDPIKIAAIAEGMAPHPFDGPALQALLGEHTQLAALVSFIGVPHCRPGDIEGTLPAMYVLGDWAGPTPAWRKTRHLRALFIEQPAERPEDSPRPDQPLPELFAHRFKVLR